MSNDANSQKENSPRNYPYCRPRRWRSKQDSTKQFKVVPWFQPIDNESKYDFKGLIKEIDPTFTDDVLADFEVYSGLVVHMGWQLLNDHGIWFCLQKNLENQFEDLGAWYDNDGPRTVAFSTCPGAASKDMILKYRDKIERGGWQYYIQDCVDQIEQYGNDPVPEEEKVPCVGFGHIKEGFVDDAWTEEEQTMMEDILQDASMFGYEIVEATFAIHKPAEEVAEYLESLGFKKGTPKW